MKIRMLGVIAAAALSFLSAAPALAAPALGDQLTCGQVGGGTFTCSSALATVGSGTEFYAGNATNAQYLGIDFGSNTLTITANADQILTSTILNFTDPTTPFTSLSLVSNNGFTGFNVANSFVTNGVLAINLRGTTSLSGSTLQFSLGSVAAATPEPATWALMILGFGAVGLTMRRRAAAGRLAHA